MKVICDAPGQTCNRLWSYVGMLSECIVKKQKMVILFFDYTIEDFPYFRNNSLIYFPFYHKWLLEIGRNWGRFKHLTWIVTHNRICGRYFEYLGFKKGWDMRRDIQYIKQAKEELIHIFTPNIIIVNTVKNLFLEMRKNADIVVGVHVRRGDYATWQNGRFFYSFSDYYNYMQQVDNLYPTKRVVFFVSSNERIPYGKFRNLQCYYYKDNSSSILDLYSLSQCDRIIGPISTFSRWASFIGEKPICFLEKKDQIITEQSFSVVIDFFHLANGRELYDW